mmetsp:Transcript_112145/g.311643  ORF Transcript_112145/g.311643 Transcript_112145/m.311643 type:complete len:243 (+) Transcript_112145:247-975(+)
MGAGSATLPGALWGRAGARRGSPMTRRQGAVPGGRVPDGHLPLPAMPHTEAQRLRLKPRMLREVSRLLLEAAVERLPVALLQALEHLCGALLHCVAVPLPHDLAALVAELPLEGHLVHARGGVRVGLLRLADAVAPVAHLAVGEPLRVHLAVGARAGAHREGLASVLPAGAGCPPRHVVEVLRHGAEAAEGGPIEGVHPPELREGVPAESEEAVVQQGAAAAKRGECASTVAAARATGLAER